MAKVAFDQKMNIGDLTENINGAHIDTASEEFGKTRKKKRS